MDTKRKNRALRVALLGLCCAMALALAACGDDNGSDDAGGSADAPKGTGSITLAGFGGTTQKALDEVFLRPFAKEKGLRPLDDAVDYAKLYSMVDSGNVTWDLVVADGWFAKQACDEGKAEPLTDVVKEAIEKAGLPEEYYGDCYIEPWSYSWVLAWRTDKIKQAPQSWAAFTDPGKFPGKRTAWSFDQVGLLEAATLAAGKSRDEVYPIEFDTVFGELDKIKKDIAFNESLQGQVTDLVSGRVTIGPITANRAVDAKAAGEPVDFRWEDQILTGEPYFVPKGSPNKDAAMELLASLLDTDKALEFAEKNKYGANGSVAQEALADKPWCNTVTTCPEHLETAFRFSDDWWSENRKEVEREWKSWLGA